MIRTASLSQAQQLVIWSARVWIHGYVRGECATERIFQAYQLTGIAEAAQEIDELFILIVGGSENALYFGATHCPAVHPIEALLINCLSAFQNGDQAMGAGILGRFLNSKRVPHAASSAQRWADALQRVGWPLQALSLEHVASSIDASDGPHLPVQDFRQPARSDNSQAVYRPHGVTLH